MSTVAARDGAGGRASKAPLAGRAIAGTATGLVAAAALLAWLPGLVGRSVAGLGPAVGEAAFTVGVFGPLLLLGVAGGALTGVRAWAPGARAGARVAGGAALGLTGLLLALGLAAIAGTVRHGPGSSAGPGLLAGAAVVLVQVAAEEVYFRGWLQPLLARAVGERVAIPAIAVAFALLHLLAGGAGALALVNLTLGGVLFGLLARADIAGGGIVGGGIAGAVAAHFAWNAAEQLLLGVDPNPGVGGFGALFDLDLVGATRWGGSAEGLNASWAMASALAAVIAPLLLARRR